MPSDRLQLPPAFRFSDEDTPRRNKQVSRSCCRLRGNPVRRPARLACMHRVPGQQKPSSSDLPFHERWAARHPRSINPTYAWIAAGNPNACRRALLLEPQRLSSSAARLSCAHFLSRLARSEVWGCEQCGQGSRFKSQCSLGRWKINDVSVLVVVLRIDRHRRRTARRGCR